MKNVKIYQLKHITRYKYENYDYAIKNGFNPNSYTLMYDCNREDNYDLEDAFHEFNAKRPIDFHGHSLSVSDIVELNGVKSYCDSFGWVEI